MKPTGRASLCALAATAVLALASPAAAQQARTLKDAYASAFRIGAALNTAQIFERDPAETALIAAQFNAITPENILKWQLVHPQPDSFDFAAADRYVEFGRKHGMFIVGHTLVWHSQTPAWVFQDSAGRPLTRDALLDRMHQHISAVVGRYRGRIGGWDVVNEALNEDGTLRQSPWQRIIGDDYLVKAFQFAHEADPQAELYYNDYSLENAPKRAGAVALVRKLQDAGVQVTAIGTQDHVLMDWPTVAQLDSTIRAFAALGVHVNVTELDVDVLPRRGPATADVSQVSSGNLDPYTAGLPDSVQQALARRYADLFRVYLQHQDVMDRITFWGVTDGQTWLNNFPTRGRTNHPLLFDRAGKPKPAFAAVIAVAGRKGT